MAVTRAGFVAALSLVVASLCACGSGRGATSADTVAAPVATTASEPVTTTPTEPDTTAAAEPVATTTLAVSGGCANTDLHDLSGIVAARPSHFAGVVVGVLGEALPARWDDPDNTPPEPPTSVETAPPSIYTPWRVLSGTAWSGSVPTQVAVLGGVADGTEVIGPPTLGLQAGREVFMILYADTVGGDGTTYKPGLVLPIVDHQVFVAGGTQADDFPAAAPATLAMPTFTGRQNEPFPTSGHLVPQDDVAALFS